MQTLQALAAAARGYEQPADAQTQKVAMDYTPESQRALEWLNSHQGTQATMLDKGRLFIKLPLGNTDQTEDHVVPVDPNGNVDWGVLKSIMGY